MTPKPLKELETFDAEDRKARKTSGLCSSGLHQDFTAVLFYETASNNSALWSSRALSAFTSFRLDVVVKIFFAIIIGNLFASFDCSP